MGEKPMVGWIVDGGLNGSEIFVQENRPPPIEFHNHNQKLARRLKESHAWISASISETRSREELYARQYA
ncbi:hypothetical protein KM043_007840 [Ampulex compressa]|nr:hypothetical protein KM043_007840 [Ampulex compressa]